MSEQDNFEAPGKIRHQFKKSHYQSNMNSAQMEQRTNIKFMVKYRLKNSKSLMFYERFLGTIFRTNQYFTMNNSV